VKIVIFILQLQLLKSASANMARLYTWCGYEVSGIIFLRDLKGTVRLDRGKDMSVHISA
jgi:hypothetical protein